jgi:hypothetical protein
MHVRFRFFALLLSALIPFAAARAADAPTVSHDGLELVKSKKVDTLYRRPGATLAPYKQVALLDCEVAFRKNWQRDQASGGVRVTGADLDRTRKTLAGDFRKAFTEELGKGGYAITDKPGDDVLVVRPAIIGLDIAAPDVLTAGRTRSYATSAGEMTLYVELYDGATGEIIARVVDRRKGRDEGRMMWQTAITNRADADRMLRKWAVLARESLDAAKAGGEGP